MVLAIVLGIVIAIVGYLPLFFVTRKARNFVAKDTMGQLGLFLGTIFLSFIILAAGIIVCAVVAHEVRLYYAIAEILAFIVVVIAGGLMNRGVKK